MKFTVVPRANGTLKWFPREPTEEETIARLKEDFSIRFSAANPPPTPGTFKLTLKDLIGEMTGSNRWPCKGGPMDGEGIAKEIWLNKGAGGKKLTVSFQPSDHIDIESKDGTIKGRYRKVVDDPDGGYGFVYLWDDLNPIKASEPDPWVNQDEKLKFEQNQK